MRIGDEIDFPKVLLELTNSLNQTSTRALGGVSPDELVKNNYDAIDKMRRSTRPSLYWNQNQRVAFFKRVERRIVASPGDYVRITTRAKRFEKLAQRKFSNKELFTVDHVRFPTPSMGTVYSMYRLRDSNQEVLSGMFLTSQIIRVLDRFSPKNPSYRFTVSEWQKSTTPGMYWVSYEGKHNIF